MKKATQTHLSHLIMATARANQEGIDWLQVSMTDLMHLTGAVLNLQIEVELLKERNNKLLLRKTPPKLDKYI